jgi:hypothetical protein
MDYLKLSAMGDTWVELQSPPNDDRHLDFNDAIAVNLSKP